MKTHLAIALVAAAAVGCAGSGGPKVQQQAAPQQMAPQIPDWYNNIPRDQNYMYGRGTASSRDLQTATDQAELSARADLGSQLTTKVEAVAKRFVEQVGDQDPQLLQSFSNAQKTVVSQELAGSHTAKQNTIPDGPTYRVFVLMELPVGKASEALMSKIKADQQMYTRFRATQAFQDLDSEVKKYEDWKDKQSKPPQGF